MRQVRFSVWRVERRHELTGLIVQDRLRQGEAWLVDEALEQSAPEGMTLAMRLGTPDLFATTSGIIVPVDREVMTDVLDEALPRVRGTPDQVAHDRRSVRDGDLPGRGSTGADGADRLRGDAAIRRMTASQRSSVPPQKWPNSR